ncbi:hypothetical protein [Klebsiella quasipneumoniae]|uniref:hypothetical protein n=1 Tax=Klebsiella quasipneumoniae TaxID=1463165 RepID=UPI003F8D2F68
MTKSTITREQAQKIIVAADEVITALAGTNEDVHPDDSKKMCELWDDLNDRHAPPVVVRELARMALAAMDSEPVAWTWHYREQWHVTNDERRAEFVAKDGDVAVLPLYRHAQSAQISEPVLPLQDKDLQGVIDALEHPAGINAAGKQVVRHALVEIQERRKADREPVAEVVSIYGDPEAFGEREIRPLVGIQQMPYGTKLYRHAQPAPEYPETLPCPVLLEPGLRFGKGIKTSTMLAALARRAVHESDMAALSPEERAEFQARIEDFKALIAQPVPVVPQDVLEALQKVARIRLDMNDFDGDRRGIADCLGDAEEALIEVVNRRAAMLAAAPQEVKP